MYVTGGSISDVVTAGIIGVVTGGIERSALGFTVNAVVSIYNGIKAGTETGSVLTGIIAGSLSFGASLISGGNLNSIKSLNARLSKAGAHLFDASFGFGATLISDGTQAGLSASHKQSQKTSASRRVKSSKKYNRSRYHTRYRTTRRNPKYGLL